MAYNPTIWKDQIVTDPTKYKITKENGTEEVVNIEKVPGKIIQEGTRITAGKLNNIEEGIKGAADLINDLAGVGRTEETVKKNADDIGSLSTQMAELAKKATNQSTATDGQVMTANGDGTFSFKDNPINIVDINNKEFIPVMGIQSMDISPPDSSPSQNGTSMAFASNSSYIFIGGNSRELWKVDKNTLQKIGSTADLGADIRGIIADENFVYVACQNLKFKKLDVNTLVQVAEYSKKVETGLFCACQDDIFLYVKSDQRTIEKIDKSTMVCKADFTDYDSNISIYDIAIKNNDIYTVGKYSSVGRLRKLSKTDMSSIYYLNTSNDIISNICVDSDGAYSYENWVTGTPITSTLYKRNISTRSIIKNVVLDGLRIDDMVLVDGFIYTIQGFMGESPDVSSIKKYDLDLNLIASCNQDISSWAKIEVDEANIFTLVGNKVQKIPKESFTYYDGNTDKNDILASNIIVDYKIDYLRRV